MTKTYYHCTGAQLLAKLVKLNIYEQLLPQAASQFLSVDTDTAYQKFSLHKIGSLVI